jgi:hypothetical protein
MSSSEGKTFVFLSLTPVADNFKEKYHFAAAGCLTNRTFTRTKTEAESEKR